MLFINYIQQIMAIGEVFWRRGAVMLIEVFLLLSLNLGQAQENLKSCYHEELLDCPPNALCSQLNTSSNTGDLKCICLKDFHFNPRWNEIQNHSINNNITSSMNSSTTSIAELEEKYCILSTAIDDEENKIVFYMRSAADPQHLVFGITLVLLAAILATGLLYALKVLLPWKRTKAVYRRLRNRRQNITPLQEMDELEMNRRYEMETF